MSGRGVCPGCGREIADLDEDAIYVQAAWLPVTEELAETGWYHWHCTSVAALDPVHSS
ncbi:MAG TPA: hypothetical protein VFC33_05805 [Acidimicrobiia bacterium]|nr:hypothetical protein [Acidimicrobiia bacterium]